MRGDGSTPVVTGHDRRVAGALSAHVCVCVCVYGNLSMQVARTGI